MKSGALLVDVDSVMPNLALMKISTWRKSLGIPTGWSMEDPSEVWASIVFNRNRHLADGLRFYYPNAVIDIGGGGFDLRKRLPQEVDLMMPDYSLYPDMDYDLGFSSRGCNRHCYFCVVPPKEGRFRRVQHPSEFHDPSHKSIVLLDNNLMFDPEWFFEVTDWILHEGMTVDFNQGFDVRLLTPEMAERIHRMKPRTMWHFAFDSMDCREAVVRGCRMLEDAGVNLRSQVHFYVYVHNDNHVDDALARCNILRDLGTGAYVMLNRDAVRTQRMTDLKRWAMPAFFFNMPFADYRGGHRRPA